MLYAETGRCPIEVAVQTRMISFWSNLIQGDPEKLSSKLYRYMLDLENFNSKWLNKIRTILTNVGRYDIWLLQNGKEAALCKLYLKQTLHDQNLQNWHDSLRNSNKGQMYSIYKDNIQFEPYLTILKRNEYLILAKFRTGNHYLPVEKDRWNGVEISERKCNLCNLHDIGDEMHYLLKCPFFETSRKLYLNRHYYTRPNILKFQELMKTKSKKQLQNLCMFIKCIFDVFKC